MLKHLNNQIKLLICSYNYKKKLQQLHKNKNKKIRVLFYVCENSKWCYQSLYEALDREDNFEPLVVVSLLDGVHKGKDKTRNNIDENYNFFKSRGMNVEYAYKDYKYVDLKSFKPDIVFYEQPWWLPKCNRPLEVSKYALTMYCSYGFSMYDLRTDYTENFHKLLFKFFTDSDVNTHRFESYKKGNSNNCVTVGYLKLDIYSKDVEKFAKSVWKNPNLVKIIYAPHHSYDVNGLNTATFRQNGKFILNLAKSMPNTTWVFKPHPQFKYALLKNNIMTEEEIDNYYKQWNEIGIIYDKGGYFDIFKTSDLMITDCCSFLGEYFPTGKPIIRLTKKDSKPLNQYGQMLVNGYYNVYENDEIEKILNDLIFNNNDYKHVYRENIIQKSFKPNISLLILKDIIKTLQNNE